MTENPLSKYFRRPELYIDLPSKGQWWPKGSLEMPPNGEIPIMSMSGKDDLMLRNADGLMNGASTVEIVQSCCPSIKDAWKMPMIDLEKIFMAIRIATYGNAMDFEYKCESCENVSDFTADLGNLMQNTKFPDYDKPLDVEGLLIYLKPSDYASQNQMNQEKYAQQRTIQMLQNSQLTEEEKLKRLQESLIELTKITVSKMTEFIDYIITQDGEKISDRQFIDEFVTNAEQKIYKAIKDGITSKNGEYKLPDVDAACPHCGNKSPRKFLFDPASFFGKGS